MTHQQQPGCVDTWLIAGLGRGVYDAVLEHFVTPESSKGWRVMSERIQDSNLNICNWWGGTVAASIKVITSMDLKKMSYVVEIHDFIVIPPTQHKQNSMVTFGRFPGIKLGKVSFLENLKNYETTLFFFLFLLRSVSQRTVKWKLLFIEVFQLIIKEWYN